MLLVLGIAVLIFSIGHMKRIPTSKRWGMIAVLLLLVIGAHLILPDGSGLRSVLGGDAAQWALVLGLGVMVWLYRLVLVRVQARADSNSATLEDIKPKPLFSDAELGRYARQIIMRDVGGAGQKALKEAKVLVIGAGGLGSPALQYLAAMGVGHIGVIDGDEVESSNLQRQVIHRDQDIGVPKAFSAKRAVEDLNPFITVAPYNRRLTEEIAEELFAEYDVILDGTDNFDTRYLSNQVAAKLGKPLISGALAQWEGQISVFDVSEGTACYQCVFPERPAPGLVPSCSEAGVAAPLPGVIGSMMAQEAMKIITGAGAPLRGEMLIYDAQYADARKIRLKRRDDCPVCGNTHG